MGKRLLIAMSVLTLAGAVLAAAPIREADVEGVVAAVAERGGTITLADGMQLSAPRSVRIEHLQLKPGDVVKASFENHSGRNVVTSIQTLPAPAPPDGSSQR